jgi:hypothetical protein
MALINYTNTNNVFMTIVKPHQPYRRLLRTGSNELIMNIVRSKICF